MKEVIVLTGPPGSGKSTWAKNYIKYELTDTFYISQDEQGKEDHKILFNTILKDGKFNIIVDRMGFSKEQRNRYLIPAKEAGYLTRIVSFYESRDVCFNRIINRQNHQTIKFGDMKTANKVLNFFFKKWEKPDPSEADIVQHIYPEGSKPYCIVSDIDNTLANASHREHFVNTLGKKKDWKGFFNAMGEDTVNPWCKDIINTYSTHKPNINTMLVSARPENYRKITEQWLLDNNVFYNNLIMRQRDDFRRDDIVKEQILDFEILTKYNILFWIDDRKQVIDKIRSRGITVLDCKGPDGDF